MKEVPSQGRPRGPGGRVGVALDAGAVAVADMSRELLGHEKVPVHDTPPAPRIFREWPGVTCDWQGRFSGNGTHERGYHPCYDRKSAQIIQNREDRGAPSRRRVRNLMIALDLRVCDK